MDTEAKLKQIMDVLDQIAEDTSVPSVTSAIMIMDDLANDPNIPLHGRTLIWNVISQLETVR